MKSLITRSKNHLESVEESYSTHAFFAAKTGVLLLKLGIMAFGHALLPALWPSDVSETISQMHEQIQKRKSQNP